MVLRHGIFTAVSIHHTTRGLSNLPRQLHHYSLHPQHRKRAVRRPCTGRGRNTSVGPGVCLETVTELFPDQLGENPSGIRAGHWSPPPPSSPSWMGASVLTLDPVFTLDLVSWAKRTNGEGPCLQGQSSRWPWVSG